jgi:hypothetical protein
LQQLQVSPQQHVAAAFSPQQHFADASGAAKLVTAIALMATNIVIMRFMTLSFVEVTVDGESANEERIRGAARRCGDA